jgi:hypothetical protein
MSKQGTKILYIAGYERSGSTILQNVLGQATATFAMGEVREIWERGLLQNRPCGCNVPFRECSVWQPILDRALSGSLYDWHKEEDLKNLQAQQSKVRNRHFPLLFLPGGPSLIRFVLGNYPSVLERLYESAAHETKAHVVIDASKSPVYGWILDATTCHTVYILHLVRDARAVAYSIEKRRKRGHKGYANYSPLRGAIEWRIVNHVTNYLERIFGKRYLQVRYEDFTDSPREVVKRIHRWIDVPSDGIQFQDDSTVRLEPTHTVVGSPHRFETGDVTLRRDQKWRTSLEVSSAQTVQRVTYPLLYGYHYL